MQNVIVALILLAAAAYLGRKAWRTVRAGGDRQGDSNDGCSNCH